MKHKWRALKLFSDICAIAALVGSLMLLGWVTFGYFVR